MEFRITYDGPAVANGRMAITDLAPAMLSMARLVEHSAQVIAGTTAAVRVEVKADFIHGSFSFETVAAAVKATTDHLWGNSSIGDLLQSIGVAGSASAGLIGLVRKARGRRAKKVENATTDEADVTLEDGEKIRVSINVAQLFINSTVRGDLAGVVAPLDKDGYEELRFGRGPKASVTIHKAEVEYFRAPESTDQVLQDSVQPELLQVIAPAFEEGYKWRFARPGEASFPAAMLDAQFVKKIQRHEVTFGRGDLLSVAMRTRVTRTAGGEFSRLVEVVEVLKHLPAGEPPQGDLFGGPPDAPGTTLAGP